MTLDLKERYPVFITDLDGTLLDQQTYSYEASLRAIAWLQKLAIPLVFCSSKTAAEIIPLKLRLGIKHPFICESGGAIYLPPNYFCFKTAMVPSPRGFDVIEFGTKIFYLRQTLQEAAHSCAAAIQSFGAMSCEEIVAQTGLTLDQAIHARQREYDEPFTVESGNADSLCTALRAKGLTVTKGDRFFHVTGGHDKGVAVKALLKLYKQEHMHLFSIGLGNSANDLSLLRQTDIAVLVRNPDGYLDGEVAAQLGRVYGTDGIGPVGWCEAVENVLGREWS